METTNTNTQPRAVGPSRSSGPSKVRDIMVGNLCILVSTIFFGIDVPVVKILIPTWMTSMDVTAFRMLGACLLMWATSLFIKNEKIQRGDWKKIIMGGAIGLFAFIFLFNLALRFSNPIDVSIIMTMPPAFVVIINILFFGARPSRLEITGLIVSFAGAFIVIALQHSGDKGSDAILGDVLALISSLCYAFYLVITSGPSKTYKPVNMLKWVYLAASIPTIFLIPGLVHAPIWHTADAKPWLLIAFVVVCVSYVSYFLMAPAIKLISSELVSIYQYLVPVVASIASLALGIASINWIQIVAMVVIIGGMVMSNVGQFKRKKAHIVKLAAHGITEAAKFSESLSPAVEQLRESARQLDASARKIEEYSAEETLDATKIDAEAAIASQEAEKIEEASSAIRSLTSPHLGATPSK